MTTAVEIYQQGGIIAYPTEAVFGLGCDPDNIEAINNLLAIKQRPKEKGLILLAAEFSQLLPYIDESKISLSQYKKIVARWPNGITQVLPARSNVSKWLSGKFDSIAVRVTNQPDVVILCNEVKKPIVSTSANFSGQQPAKEWHELPQDLVNKIDFVIKGETLGYSKPSNIIDGLTGEVFRS